MKTLTLALSRKRERGLKTAVRALARTLSRKREGE
jgi:hypothetical protein